MLDFVDLRGSFSLSHSLSFFLCFGNSLCFYHVVCETGFCAAARSSSVLYHHSHTHTHSDTDSKVLSVAAVLKVCERIRLHGEEGSQVKEGVMFVSVRATRLEPLL